MLLHFFLRLVYVLGEPATLLLLLAVQHLRATLQVLLQLLSSHEAAFLVRALHLVFEVRTVGSTIL